MSRHNSRDAAGSDDDLSDYDSRRGNRPAPKPSRNEPAFEVVRKRPVPPTTNRRSHDRDEDLEERRPPPNRDTRERRPPPGRVSRDRTDDGEREQSRDRALRESSASRDSPMDRNPRDRVGSRSRERYDDEDDDRNIERSYPRLSRDPDDGRGSRNTSRDRGDGGFRNNSRERYYDEEDDHYGHVRESRDRAVRSSRDGAADVRRSREAPKDFTPKSYVRPNGTPPASAWSGDGQRQFEKENTRPLARGDSWTSSVKHRPPPSAVRANRRTDDDSDDDMERREGFNRRTNSTRVNRHISREDDESERRDSRDRGFARARQDEKDEDDDRYGRSDSRDRGVRRSQGLRDDDYEGRQQYRERPSGRRGDREREREEELMMEESQDNDITPFSQEKPKKPAAASVRRQPSPDLMAGARRLDSDDEENGGLRRTRGRADSRCRGDDNFREGRGGREQEYDEDEREYREGSRNRDNSRDNPRRGGGDRKWEDAADDGADDGGISANDMRRLENYRKSGRYVSNDDDDRGRKGGYSYKPSGNVPMVHYCPPNGGNTDLFQCYIVRERNGIGSKLYPTYKMYSQEGDKLLILARKMSMNSTSNYHLFDMTRGIPEKTNLSKKSGNYIGKLRGIDTNHSEYVLVTKSVDKHEVAAIQFDRLGLVSQLKDGCQPRKMSVLLPTINSDNEPIPHQLKHTDGSKKKPKSLATLLRRHDFGNKFYLVSKDPTYENGNYRLNFHGRVSIPSVKNFQLTCQEDLEDVICQFGKVGDETFNLDFKYPLNPFQAFSLALCHFDA